MPYSGIYGIAIFLSNYLFGIYALLNLVYNTYIRTVSYTSKVVLYFIVFSLLFLYYFCFLYLYHNSFQVSLIGYYYD